MNTKWIITSTFLILSSFGAVQAQRSNPVGLGARLSPDGAGFSAKFFVDRHVAIEAQVNGSVGFWHGPDRAPDYGPSMTLVGLLEYNVIFDDPSWRLFFGPGLHVGTWDMYHNNRYDYNRDPQGIFGLDGILGVEYIFKRTPIGLSADIKPAMNFVSDLGFFPNNFFGLSIRYYLGRGIPAPPAPPVR